MRRPIHSTAGVGLLALLLAGCRLDVLHPQGPVGVREASLIAITLGAMMGVVVPVFFMTFWFAWRYRATGDAVYRPEWARSLGVEITVWGVPLAIILFLGILSWRSTHLLDPYRRLQVGGEPLNVEVVALDWKWLFIYPDQHIATVNLLEIPVDRQIDFLITSDTVMNAFFIPQLGTQIYAMAGMQTQLHLLAKNPGVYRGISANFSGPGFADMRFSTNAVAQGVFSAWVRQVQAAPHALNAASYAALARPSSDNPVAFFGSVAPDFFERIAMRQAGAVRMVAGQAP